MIKFLIMDVDGTLTDGKIYMGDSGEMFKAFDIKDGCGIKDILPQFGIVPIVITARESELLKKRCDELSISELHQGIRNKLDCLKAIIEKYNNDNGSSFNFSNCAYIGDDILDLQCMKPIADARGIVGCPLDAVDSVREIANFVSTKVCGAGAVREFIEYLTSTSPKNNFSTEEKIKIAINYIDSLNFEKLKLGRYEISEGIFYMVQEYSTKAIEECKLESHKKYIDIQWIAKGKEMIQIADVRRLELQEEYDDDKDIMFWKTPSNLCSCMLFENSYIVLYPNDAHKPSIAVNESEKVMKIVVKIPC